MGSRASSWASGSTTIICTRRTRSSRSRASTAARGAARTCTRSWGGRGARRAVSPSARRLRRHLLDDLLGRSARRDSALDELPAAPVAVEVERYPFSETQHGAVLQVDVQMGHQRPPRIPDAPQRLTGANGVARLDLDRSRLEMPEEQVLVGRHLEHDVIARRVTAAPTAADRLVRFAIVDRADDPGGRGNDGKA